MELNPAKSSQSIHALHHKNSEKSGIKKLEYNQAVKRNSYYDCTLEELENHVVSLTSVENALEEEALKTFINQFLAKQRERKIDTELISDCLMDEICFKDEDHILVPGDTYMIDDVEYTGENLINLNSMCVEESYKKYGEIKLRWNYDFENDTLTITDITDDQTFSMKGLSEDYYLAEIQWNYIVHQTCIS